MTSAKLRLAQAAIGQSETKVADLALNPVYRARRFIDLLERKVSCALMVNA